jgi:hypothetical protein
LIDVLVNNALHLALEGSIYTPMVRWFAIVVFDKGCRQGDIGLNPYYSLRSLAGDRIGVIAGNEQICVVCLSLAVQTSEKISRECRPVSIRFVFDLRVQHFDISL